jgi:hypothetical protein
MLTQTAVPGSSAVTRSSAPGLRARSRILGSLPEVRVRPGDSEQGQTKTNPGSGPQPRVRRWQQRSDVTLEASDT